MNYSEHQEQEKYLAVKYKQSGFNYSYKIDHKVVISVAFKF